MLFKTVSVVLLLAIGANAQYGGQGQNGSGNQGGQNGGGSDAGVPPPPPPPPAPQTEAPTTAAPTTTVTPSNKKCVVPETPKKSGCSDTWVPVYDDDWCIASFKCEFVPEEVDAGSEGGEGGENGEAENNGGGKAGACNDLNPFKNSDVHRRKSDSRCETGNPGWGGDKSCRCEYPVQTRNDEGCATRYWRVCYKLNADGSVDEAGKTTCPPLVFPEDKPNCMIIKRIVEGCEKLEHMCMDPAEAGAAVDGGAPGVLPPAPVANTPAQGTSPGRPSAPGANKPQKQQQSGYRGRFARH